jgi:hypothetical protein
MTITCSVAECQNPPRSSKQALCEMHYYRVRRNGTVELKARADYNLPPNKVREPKPRKLPRTRQECTVPSCSTLDYGSPGYCKKHATRIARHGSPYVVLSHGLPAGPGHPNRADVPTYSGVHQRLRRERGNPSAQTCACGKRAQQWAYSHIAAVEFHSEFGAYSTDLSQYTPMCIKCHKRFDMDRITAEGRSR